MPVTIHPGAFGNKRWLFAMPAIALYLFLLSTFWLIVIMISKTIIASDAASLPLVLVFHGQRNRFFPMR
jgi:hypothetical protein